MLWHICVNVQQLLSYVSTNQKIPIICDNEISAMVLVNLNGLMFKYHSVYCTCFVGFLVLCKRATFHKFKCLLKFGKSLRNPTQMLLQLNHPGREIPKG